MDWEVRVNHLIGSVVVVIDDVGTFYLDAGPAEDLAADLQCAAGALVKGCE